MRVPDYVYHASSIRELTRLEPRASTHGTWLYAVGDPVLAACFLSGTGGDLTCAVGRERETGRVYVCERFAGAFAHRYAGKPGSIYRLSADGFVAHRTPWEEECVCDHAVRTCGETYIEDAAVHLERLARAGDLVLVHYPERIDGIPANDADLIDRAVVWLDRFGPDALRPFETYHPELLPRIRAAMSSSTDRELPGSEEGETE